MADDGTGALPLLRHVILNDAKSATYKLGLLRALCRAAEQDGLVPRLDLRVGARFGGDAAQAVRAALQETADLIARMPATYMTDPNGGPVLPTARRTASRG